MFSFATRWTSRQHVVCWNIGHERELGRRSRSLAGSVEEEERNRERGETRSGARDDGRMVGRFGRPGRSAGHRGDCAEDQHREAEAAQRASFVTFAHAMAHDLRFVADLDVDITRARSIARRYEDERMRPIREIEDTRRRAEHARIRVEDVGFLAVGFENDASGPRLRCIEWNVDRRHHPRRRGRGRQRLGMTARAEKEDEQGSRPHVP